MENIVTIESLWRYPVKSMAGEEMDSMFLGFSGVFGDRIFAFHNAAGRQGFPYLNALAQPKMLTCQPRFRNPEKSNKPRNLEQAMGIAPGVNPANATAEDLQLDVILPDGQTLSIDDPRLIDILTGDLRGEYQVTLIRSDRALTDCRPLSMISLQTISQLQEEMHMPLDKMRFRSNIYCNLANAQGFGEDQWVGRRLRIGEKAEIMVLEGDPRCKMISLDPQTGEHNPQVLRHVAQDHNNIVGIYCAVLVEGMISKNDAIQVVS